MHSVNNIWLTWRIYISLTFLGIWMVKKRWKIVSLFKCRKMSAFQFDKTLLFIPSFP